MWDYNLNPILLGTLDSFLTCFWRAGTNSSHGTQCTTGHTRSRFWVEVITLLKQHVLYFKPITSYIIVPTMSSHYVTWLYRHAVKYWNPRTSVVRRPRALLRKSISAKPNKINHWKWDAYFLRAYSTALDKWEYLFHYLLWFFFPIMYSLPLFPY